MVVKTIRPVEISTVTLINRSIAVILKHVRVNFPTSCATVYDCSKWHLMKTQHWLSCKNRVFVNLMVPSGRTSIPESPCTNNSSDDWRPLLQSKYAHDLNSHCRQRKTIPQTIIRFRSKRDTTFVYTLGFCCRKGRPWNIWLPVLPNRRWRC